jgi:tetratricopeptide (TPR) repeat protein
MKADLSLADAETYAPDTLDKIRRNTGTDLVVFGSYLVEEKGTDRPIRLDLRVQDTKTGETIASMVETGTRDDFNGLVDRAGRDLRQQLNTGEISAAEAAALHASLPANSDVARLYSEGLTKLRLFDAVGARDLLQKAVEAEPGFALAHSALAEAWSDLGNDARAREEAAKALDLSSRLSREDQLLIQGRYRELNAEWEKAIETYRSLWQFFPDNLDYGLRLASVQTSAGRGQDALATVEELRKLPPPARDDARVDLEEAAAAKSMSDFKREDAAGERATKKAQGARLLSAQGQLERCWALYNLGQLEEAKKACDQAKDTFALAGDRKDAARAFTRLAEILDKQGDGDAALRLHELALQNMREVGSRRDIAGALVNIAMLKSDRGDVEGARTDYEEAVKIAREDDDKQHVLEYENDLGSVFYIEGDFAKANQTYEQVLATAKEIDDKGGVATALSNTGLISYLEGDLPTAQKRMKEALSMEQKLAMKSDASSTLDSLGDVLLAQGDLDGAEKNYREALGMRQQLGAKGDVAASKVSLARLAVEKGRAAEAETLAREAMGEFQAEKIQDNEIGASEVLVRALMAQGKLPEAESTMERTLKLRAQDQTVRLSLAITGARLAARTGKISEALHGLEGALKEAGRMRLTGYAFEARLAEAEIELQQGKVELAHAHLNSLEREASKSGFRLLARKAVSAREGAPKAQGRPGGYELSRTTPVKLSSGKRPEPGETAAFAQTGSGPAPACRFPRDRRGYLECER